jgi:uncharacterized protein YigE (DUF2233 family)
MKKLALTALALLAGCNQTEAEKSGAVTRIEFDKNGVASGSASLDKTAQASACNSVTFEDVPLTHCLADPAQHRITTALSPKGGSPYRSFAALKQAVTATPIAFAVNGGMFDEDGRPIGYYVEKSNRTKTLNRAKGPGNFHLLPNGVFFGTGEKWRVLSAGQFSEEIKQRPEFGTQSGPMLVIDGKLHPRISEDGESRVIRNAVGVDDQGRAHFVISDAPLSFGKLARYFRDELKTPNALFLDGNVSSLWDPATGRMDETVPLGPLIAVENRAKAKGEKKAP